MMVLSVIKSEDMYGYRIIRELETRSENAFSLKEGTLYPILHALEKEKLVESYWVTANGRKRKYYHITKKGAKRLAEKKRNLRSSAFPYPRYLTMRNERKRISAAGNF